MDIAILGAGIDGLLAAHAAVQSGHDTMLYGDEEIQYAPRGARALMLRRDIPYITNNLGVGQRVNIKLNKSAPFAGFAEAYMNKVYGPEDAEFYSERYMLDELVMLPSIVVDVFDAREAYKILYEIYSKSILYQWITPKWYTKLQIRHDHDLIINTLPITKWCGDGRKQDHIFSHSVFWYTNSAPFGPMHKNEILLDASDTTAHYLQANLFGDWIAEWPAGTRPPPIDGLYKEKRPLFTDCDCAASVYDFINVGQFAQWDHMIPIHDSYYKTVEIIEAFARKPQQLDLGL